MPHAMLMLKKKVSSSCFPLLPGILVRLHVLFRLVHIYLGVSLGQLDLVRKLRALAATVELH